MTEQQMSANFARHEFRCRCGCGADHVRQDLVDLLQRLRDEVGRPVVVNSGVRCARHNARVGGAKASRHLTGEAADVRVSGMTPRAVARIADRLLGRRGGVKAYASFTHIDIRPGYWREGL